MVRDIGSRPTAQRVTRRAVLVLAFAASIGGCAADSRPLRVAEADHELLAARPVGEFKLASASGNFLAGAHAQRTRDFSAAADFFAGAMVADRSNRRLQLNAFLAMVASGRVADSIPLARHVVAQDAGSPIASLTLVAEAARAGDFAQAAERLATLPRRGMNTFSVPLLQAWALAAQGQTAEAIETLKPLAEIAGFAALRELHVALINEFAGRDAAAEAAYRAATQDRLSLRVVRAFGAFLERQNRGEEARALYEKFIADQPELDTIDLVLDHIRGRPAAKPEKLVNSARDGMAEVFFNLAGTLAQSRSADQSLIYGRLALFLRPDFPIAQLLVGGVLETLDRNGEAIAIYEVIDRSSPLAWSARLRRAAGLDAMGRTEEAIAELRAMAEADPAEDDVLIRLGDLLRAKKRYAEAAEAYSEAVQRIGSLEKRHWGVLYARGITYERQDKWAEAEQDFLRALELSPEQPYVLNYLGYSWVEKGLHLKRAQEMIERAVQLRPDDGYIVDSLGWVMYQLGDFQGATTQLERAVVLRPDDATINDHLGDAYWRVGRLNEARFQWRRALSLDPEKEQIPDIERKLREGLGDSRHAQGRRS